MSNKEIIEGFEVTELGLYSWVGNYEVEGCLGIYSGWWRDWGLNDVSIC